MNMVGQGPENEYKYKHKEGDFDIPPITLCIPGQPPILLRACNKRGNAHLNHNNIIKTITIHLSIYLYISIQVYEYIYI